MENRPGNGVNELAWYDRYSRWLTVVVAAVPPVLYLAFVVHYAVNSVQADEWNQLPFLDQALHGHLAMSQLWSQYGEPRIPLVRLYLLFFASVDHLNLRVAIVGNAVLFIAAYGILLILFRRYLGERLTPPPVLAIGLVWFSLADVQNALWAFQVGWYLVTLGFMVVLAALLLPRQRRSLWIGVAILAAVVATLAWIQGFVVWPVGLLCIVWTRGNGSRRMREAVAWCSATVVMTITYFVGYNRSVSSCIPDFGCKPMNPLTHPIAAVRFLITVVGNAVPGGFTDGTPHSYLRFQLVGTMLIGCTMFVVVQSFRFRSTSERIPLPLLLVTFPMLFDATLVWGRVGAGPAGAIESNRYVMPNVILVVGIMLYAWSHRPRLRSLTSRPSGKSILAISAMVIVGALVVLQIVVATGFGIRGAAFLESFGTGRGRLTVNWDRVPEPLRSCEATGLFVLSDLVPIAARNQLGEFGPTSYWYFRRLGPPAANPGCLTSKATAAPKA